MIKRFDALGAQRRLKPKGSGSHEKARLIASHCSLPGLLEAPQRTMETLSRKQQTLPQQIAA